VPRPLFFDAELERRLRDDGYAIVDLMAPEEAAGILRQLEALHPDDGYDPDGQGINRARYHCTFLDSNHDYRASVQEIITREFQPRIDGVLDDCTILTGNVYVKQPGLGRFEIHQNWPTTPDIRQTTVTVWCPLVDVSEANGTIQLVPRSHKIVPDICAVSAPKYFEPFYDELIERWLEPVSLRAGQCLIFDDGLLHWSDDNTSDAPRWVIQIETLPSEVQPVVFYFDQEHDPPRFEYFAVDAGFYVEHDITKLLTRPEGLRPLGFVERSNERLTEEQFARLMELGPATRARVFADEPVETAFPPVPPAMLGEWADVSVDDLDGFADAIDRIYAGSLDGMTIRGVLGREELARAIARVEEHRSEFKDHGKQALYGTPLVGADDARTDYFADAWRINDRLGDLFDFDFEARIADVLSRVGGGRKAVVPDEGPGKRYVPATFRFLPPGQGVMHAHTANEFCNVWSAYDHLRATARMWNSLSYFILGEEPDEGGELVLYDLQFDDTPDDIGALGMSEERDALLQRIAQRPVPAGPGDMILFTGGRIWHRVAPVTGERRRVTIGGFVAVSNDDDRIYYWS
jgi:hypothetical protein